MGCEADCGGFGGAGCETKNQLHQRRAQPKDFQLRVYAASTGRNFFNRIQAVARRQLILAFARHKGTSYRYILVVYTWYTRV